jgi:GH24 family phage-related lysozyme (muramidase)
LAPPRITFPVDIDPRLIADLDAAEQCDLVAYQDSLGIWTIGWGHELFPQTNNWTGTVWTQAQADAQRATDIEVAATFAQGLTEWPSLDTDCRRNAVIELCFNMRRKWLLFVNTRAAIRRQDWKGAHDGLLSSLWAEQVHADRADRLADYLLSGQYP